MRRIDPADFKIAKRTTSRDINRQIVLNLIRDHQPISRAELSRKMNIGRGVITVLSNELLNENLIFEGATGESQKGRKPTLLYIKSENRLVVAVDVRSTKTFLMLTDFAGNKISLEIFDTPSRPDALVDILSTKIRLLIESQDSSSFWEGIGIVVPGITDNQTGRIVRAPTLGWENVEISASLEMKTGLPVKIENAPKACALAQIWTERTNNSTPQNFVYVTVSDGVGVGIVINGELVRGLNDIAGEYGHLQITKDGNRCACGKKGCLETFVSNPATINRYLGKSQDERLSIDDLTSKAKAGDERAIRSLKVTGTYLGIGFSNIINTLNPEVIFLGGEITKVWDLFKESVFESVAEHALVEVARKTPVRIAPAIEYPRLRGAASLIIAPTFAALRIA